jgi:hypothetical protein
MQVLAFLVFVPLTSKAGTLKDEYDLKKKCSEEASQYYNALWVGTKINQDGSNIHAEFTNHYNKKLNTCLILTIVHNYEFMKDGIIIDKTLTDLHENSDIAVYNYQGQYKALTICRVNETKCKSEKEFDELVKPYMTQ